MKRLSKFEIILAILGPILLLPLVGFCAFMFFMFLAPCKALNIEIEKELSRIRAEGEPVSLEELAPPLIPEDENAAFIYEKAFQKMERIPPEMRDLLEKRPSELTSQKRTALKDFFDENKEVFLLLDQAMTYKRCRFPVDYQKGFFAEFPHLSKLRDSARLLALKSLRQLDEGKVEEAANTSLKMIKLSNSLSTEPFLISQLVRIAIGRMMVDSLEDILAEGELSVKTLRRLIEALNTFGKEMRGGLGLAFLGERCLFVSLLGDHEQFFFLKKTDVGIPLSKQRFLMDSRFMRSGKLYSLRIWRRLIDLTRLPLHQAIKESKELDAEIDQRWKELLDLPSEMWEANEFEPWRLGEMLPVMLLGAMGRSIINWAYHEAEINQARIAAALELYQKEHGIYPEYLRDIPSHILSPLPKDPFTGEDFIYRRENGDFLLYSVGGNLKDDGGIAFIQTEEREKERADIVWGQ